LMPAKKGKPLSQPAKASWLETKYEEN
jgi:hypothetical protein